jgi:hypothetical protein
MALVIEAAVQGDPVDVGVDFVLQFRCPLPGSAEFVENFIPVSPEINEAKIGAILHIEEAIWCLHFYI